MKVSITTVTYNSAATLARTIEAVLNQTYPDIEYIVMDGASTDNTVEIARSFIDKFHEKGYEMKVISQPDGGMYDALNKAIALCTGELIGNTNSDDWYEPEAVAEMAAFYEREHYDLAWSDLRIVKPNGNIIKHAKVGRLWTTSGFCHPTMFATKQVLTEFPYACRAMDDDFEMVTRAKLAGKKICTLPKVLSNYTFGGMSTAKSFKNTRMRIKMKYSTYRLHGFSPLYWFYCVAMEMAKFILG